jgi:hypothetical protein
VGSVTSEDHDLRRFAELLVRLVRDRAIVACDKLAADDVRGTRGEYWQALAADPAARDTASALIPEVVDEVLFQLLDAVDNGKLPIAWRGSEDGSWVSLEELGQGEMAGWLTMGKGGWLDSFSGQRHVDHLAACLSAEPCLDSSTDLVIWLPDMHQMSAPNQ